MFYGIQLQIGESKNIEKIDDHDQFVISRAVLIKGSNANIMINGIIIASLNQKTTQLNLNFRINPEQYQTTITNQGNGIVHLTGYYIKPLQMDEEIDNTFSVAALLKQNNNNQQKQQQQNVNQSQKIQNKKQEQEQQQQQQLKQQQKVIIKQKKWDECDWEDEEFLKRIK